MGTNFLINLSSTNFVLPQEREEGLLSSLFFCFFFLFCFRFFLFVCLFDRFTISSIIALSSFPFFPCGSWILTRRFIGLGQAIHFVSTSLRGEAAPPQFGTDTPLLQRRHGRNGETRMLKLQVARCWLARIRRERSFEERRWIGGGGGEEAEFLGVGDSGRQLLVRRK